MINEVAFRYAKALHELSQAANKTDLIQSELRVVSEAVIAQPQLKEFFSSPLISPAQKTAAIVGGLKGKISEELIGTLQVMAEKSRLDLFQDLNAAFEEINDTSHGVIRGTVRSAAPVSNEERKKIEDTVHNVIKKKVILSYQEDPSLLGGMVAEVAGWTFDDSLKSHLHKLKEELHRRAN